MTIRKPKSGIAIEPNGACHSGWILDRATNGSVWGFVPLLNPLVGGLNDARRPMNLPPGSVIVEMTDVCMISDYPDALNHATNGSPGYHLIQNGFKVGNIVAGAPIVSGHLGPVMAFPSQRVE
jgi:hypothetical protein